MIEVETHRRNPGTNPLSCYFISPMPAAPRLITLMTDFGLKDHFVGVMKGVIAGIAPGARRGHHA